MGFGNLSLDIFDVEYPPCEVTCISFSHADMDEILECGLSGFTPISLRGHMFLDRCLDTELVLGT